MKIWCMFFENRILQFELQTHRSNLEIAIIVIAQCHYLNFLTIPSRKTQYFSTVYH